MKESKLIPGRLMHSEHGNSLWSSGCVASHWHRQVLFQVPQEPVRIMSASLQAHAQVDPGAGRSLLLSQSGCYTSSNSQLFLPSNQSWRTRRCIQKRPRICFITQDGQHLHMQAAPTHPSGTEIFSDWGRTSRTQSPLQIWKMSDFVDWPQTSGID